MERHAITHHTIRCPLQQGIASLTVRTQPGAPPSRRHRDVMTCSLVPSASCITPGRKGYFSDVAPPLSYSYDVDRASGHSFEVACSKRCLAVLNAAEPGAAPVRCTSGVNDSLELARQTQSLAIMRQLWFHSA
jgi:hypothetical protein